MSLLWVSFLKDKIIPEQSQSTGQETSKTVEMTEKLGCINNHPCPWSIHLWPTGLEYLAGFSANWEFWRIVLHCLGKVWQSISFLFFSNLDNMLSTVKTRKVPCQVTSFVKFKGNFILRFFDFIHFLCNWLVIPGADLYHCHKKTYMIKYLKCHICRSLKCSKATYLSKIYLSLILIIYITWL